MQVGVVVSEIRNPQLRSSSGPSPPNHRSTQVPGLAPTEPMRAAFPPQRLRQDLDLMTQAFHDDDELLTIDEMLGNDDAEDRAEAALDDVLKIRKIPELAVAKIAP